MEIVDKDIEMAEVDANVDRFRSSSQQHPTKRKLRMFHLGRKTVPLQNMT